MDPLQLLADLEGLRDKIPGFLQADFEDLIASIRNIYEMSVKFVTPSQPVHDGKHNLTYHHTKISNLHTQMNNSLTPFQQMYTGQGSDAYYNTAAISLQNLQLIRDHLADASQFHDTMATNFDLATEAKIALVSLLIGLGVTLGVLIFSAGTTAPVTVPAAILEAAGGTVSIGLLTDAEAAALAAVMGLVWAALPDALLSAAAVDILINNVLNPPKTIDLSGSKTTIQPIVISVPQSAQLPKPRPLTPEEEQVVQDIVNEMLGPSQEAKRAWIEYLMRILGLSMTAKQAGAVIRCMISKGYLPQITNKSAASNIQIALSKIWNSLKHLKQQDLEGAWKDVHPDRVTYPKGELPSNAQHLDEVSSAIQSLNNFQKTVLNALTDPATPDNLRKIYQDLYDACENTINYVTGKVYGSDPPLRWPDPKGEIPFGNDLIAKSGCM